MKRLIANITAIIAIINFFSACTNETTNEVTAEPFGTDFSTILEKADIESATNDYTVQCYSQNVNVLKSDGTADGFYSTFISIEAYNEYGESIQNGFGYVFETADDAVEYFEYVSGGIYEVKLNNELTVWFERETDGHYKQNIIEMHKDNLKELKLSQ